MISISLRCTFLFSNITYRLLTRYCILTTLDELYLKLCSLTHEDWCDYCDNVLIVSCSSIKCTSNGEIVFLHLTSEFPKILGSVSRMSQFCKPFLLKKNMILLLKVFFLSSLEHFTSKRNVYK